MNKIEKLQNIGYEIYDDFTNELIIRFEQPFKVTTPSTYTAQLIGALSKRKNKSDMLAVMMREFAGNFVNDLFVDSEDGKIYQRSYTNYPY